MIHRLRHVTRNGLSDILDGYLARKKGGGITTFGSYFDPAVDKLLLLIVCFLLSAVSYTYFGIRQLYNNYYGRFGLCLTQLQKLSKT
ncbi:MAG: CDP-alcohol phosphatidyltransferase family protein [Candidatus Scalindua sp.]|nr:CDP-alcohol phosphatidyltransferase family protein [Candidatus Scalindua sp.]